ncbi:hypothetical protein [Rhodopila sp.]|uniref:hypothetical protein n=1 Tax=Rhodopila sp. TaxID=2480087 RepID=UPI003D09ACA9
MRLRGLSHLAAFACTLAGCHQPMVEPKLPSFQSTENTVRDWKNAAHEVASELASQGFVAPRPIFIAVQPDSMFLRQAGEELQADILRRHGTIASSPYNATVVSLGVDVVHWSGRDLHTSNSEAILRATAKVDGNVVMKLVEPVYVRDRDEALYLSPPPLPTRLLRYDQ